MANRLIHETSPYLLQHAHNPVDWYPWGSEAFRSAKDQDKPIFLSIGYAACHWCHVMEKESFEDNETAKTLNTLFISIKVDREERPDVDHLYMNAVQILTHHGGWPLTVFLTPDAKPFYGGTYFPPEARSGLPSFKQVLNGVATAWKSKRTEILESAQQLVQAVIQLNDHTTNASPSSQLSLDLIDKAAIHLAQRFDPEFGGFGEAPKFFHTMDLRLALRLWKRNSNSQALEMATTTLDALANGGIYDQLAGGFHRYSTDRKWLVPHFEKMLYDNALLAQTYLEAYQATRKPCYARIACETLDYVLGEMTSNEGGFFSTQDADSEEEEGKFYVWTSAEIQAILGEDLAHPFGSHFNVAEAGNWEHGNNILHVTAPLSDTAKRLGMESEWLESAIQTARRRLLIERSQRVAPRRDEKIILAWNGLMIEAFALGYQVLNDPRYLQAATNAAHFAVKKLLSDGKWLHVYKDGRAKHNACLDDHANLLGAFVTLFETDGSEEWLKFSTQLADAILTSFWDPVSESFYFTPKQHEPLFTRPRETYDGATPSGTAMAITGLIRFGRLSADPKYGSTAEKALKRLTHFMEQSPSGAGQLLIALLQLRDHPQEIVVLKGEDSEEWDAVLRIFRDVFRPNTSLIPVDPDSEFARQNALAKGRVAVHGQTTVYVCENSTCQAPVVGLLAIQEKFSS